MSFNRHVPRAETSFDARLRNTHNGKLPAHNPAFDEMSADRLNTIVAKAAITNQGRHSEALSKADSYSFCVAHPEFIRNAANNQLINHQLQTWGITDPTYPDFARAYQSLRESNLLDIDKAEIAKQKDHPHRTFVGALTKQTFDDLDSMIVAERQAAIQQAPKSSEEDIDFENLPNDQVLPMLKQLERLEQQKGNAPKTGSNGDAWITLHPDYIDSNRNAELMRHQLKANGVLEDVASIADYETAYQQLCSSGLLSLNQKAVTKQHNEELKQRAADAVAEGGTVFDHTSEEAMYALDLDEVRRRANAVLGR